MKPVFNRLLILNFCLLISIHGLAQVKIGDASAPGYNRQPHATSMLQVESSTKGFLPPRILLSGNVMQLNGVTPANGMLVYNTNTAAVSGLSGAGLYIWHDAKWNRVLENELQTADLANSAVTSDKVAPGSAGQVLTTDPSGTGVKWTNGVSNRLTVNTNTTLTDTQIPVGGTLILVFTATCTITAPGGASFAPVITTATTLTSSAGTYFLSRNSTGLIDIAASPLISNVSHAEVGNYKFSVAGNLNGYLLCNGAAVSRTTYAELFSMIGTSFGAGNGSSTFNLPDFRGRVFGGRGTGTALSSRALGAKDGEENHTLTISEMPAHDHYTFSSSGGSINGGTYPSLNYNDYANNSGVPTRGISSPAGGGAAHNVMQPTLFAGNVFIKF